MLSLLFINEVGESFPIAVSHNILFAADQFFGTIHTYNAATGAGINFNFITGLNQPGEMAFSEDLDSHELFLFVANTGNNAVGKYDAITGATIDANFLTQLLNAGYIAVKNPKSR